MCVTEDWARSMSDAHHSPVDGVLLQGVPNFRDIGGYEATDGRVVRSGGVFRSGMLGNATDDDLATLGALGLLTVVDLRTQTEIDMFGMDRIPDGASVASFSMPIAGADPIMEEAMRSGRFPVLPNLTDVNRSYIADDASQIGAVLELLSYRENQPAVVHCLGGKDRTGVVIALLLTILGVPWATVRADYLRSNDYYERAMNDPRNSLNRAMESRAGDVPNFGDEDSKRAFFILQPEYIDVVLEEVTKGSRSVADFVTHQLGLSDATVERLRSELLE